VLSIYPHIAPLLPSIISPSAIQGKIRHRKKKLKTFLIKSYYPVKDRPLIAPWNKSDAAARPKESRTTGSREDLQETI